MQTVASNPTAAGTGRSSVPTVPTPTRVTGTGAAHGARLGQGHLCTATQQKSGHVKAAGKISGYLVKGISTESIPAFAACKPQKEGHEDMPLKNSFFPQPPSK